MKHHKLYSYLIIACGLLLFVFAISACNDGFLDEKPHSSLVIPESLEDCQRLLDNQLLTDNMPALGLLASDEYYMDDRKWQSSSIVERNSYTWADNVYEGQENLPDWNSGFAAIFTCNAALEILEGLPPAEGDKAIWENLKGTALFYRAYRYYELAEVFTMPYNADNASNLLGLPLRTSPNIDYLVLRATLKDTFDFILNDLLTASQLLKNDVPDEKLNRPSKVAVYGFLSRVYLAMGDYQNALANAEFCLALYDKLLDYNTRDYLTDYPFEDNPEIIFSGLRQTYANLNPFPRTVDVYIDSLLYGLYNEKDLRKSFFFTVPDNERSNRKFLYSYDGQRTQNFAGIATDEIYLIKSECLARLNRTDEAQSALDKLLVFRYENGTYQSGNLNNSQPILTRILNERRKELVFRGARWNDLRRLNAGGSSLEIQRLLNGQGYVLQPKSNKYAFPIPDSEVTLGSLVQNPR